MARKRCAMLTDKQCGKEDRAIAPAAARAPQRRPPVVRRPAGARRHSVDSGADSGDTILNSFSGPRRRACTSRQLAAVLRQPSGGTPHGSSPASAARWAPAQMAKMSIISPELHGRMPLYALLPSATPTRTPRGDRCFRGHWGDTSGGTYGLNTRPPQGGSARSDGYLTHHALTPQRRCC